MGSFAQKMTKFGSMATIVVALAIGGTTAMASPRSFNIDSQDAPRSLLEFGRQSALQILFASEKVKGIVTNAVHGSYEPIDALHLLLKGTPLVVREKSDGVLVVEPQVKERASSAREAALAEDGPSARLAGSDSSGARVPVSSDSVQGANDASSVSSGSERSPIGEIIVTAQKKAERLQDVPVPVTALNADSLLNSNQVRLLDYYDSVPNLTIQPSIQSLTTLSIRGIGAGGSASPTVAVTVDGIAYGSSGFLGAIIPDIDPGDLARIEVLRGPQGTLYGASSMGGLINFVTADPSLDAVSGRVQAGISSVFNGNELGYNVRGSLNVPLTDTFAVRMSAYHREDPGYIDNVLTHVDGVNEVLANGAHVSALWQPSSGISLK